MEKVLSLPHCLFWSLPYLPYLVPEMKLLNILGLKGQIFTLTEQKNTCHKNGRPGGIRTPNPRIWSPVLYQLELLACVSLLSLLVRSMNSTKRTIFVKLQFIGSVFLILCRRIIATFACATCKSYYISHSDLPMQKGNPALKLTGQGTIFCAVTT